MLQFPGHRQARIRLDFTAPMSPPEAWRAAGRQDVQVSVLSCVTEGNNSFALSASVSSWQDRGPRGLRPAGP